MKHHRYFSLSAILFASLVLFISCQESTDILSTENKDDPFMTEALDLIDKELTSIESNLPEASRANWRRPEYSVTCLKYDKNNDRLVYSTWNDDIKGYVEVTEEEITAFVKPGTWMFHYRGGGLSALNAIEYDAASRAIIGNATYEIYPGRLWLTKVPESCGDALLKYDIVYNVRNDGQGPIRLDPKIEVTQ